MSRELTKQNRAQCISLLKAAKEELRTGGAKYICYALLNAVGGDDSTVQYKLENYSYVRKWVQNVLHPYGTYESWMQYNHLELWRKTTFSGQYYRARIARIEWIDWMINELEAGR
jgi:hypothetical protein